MPSSKHLTINEKRAITGILVMEDIILVLVIALGIAGCDIFNAKNAPYQRVKLSQFNRAFHKSPWLSICSQAGMDGSRTHHGPQRDPPPVLKTGEPTGTQPLPESKDTVQPKN